MFELLLAYSILLRADELLVVEFVVVTFVVEEFVEVDELVVVVFVALLAYVV